MSKFSGVKPPKVLLPVPKKVWACVRSRQIFCPIVPTLPCRWRLVSHTPTASALNLSRRRCMRSRSMVLKGSRPTKPCTSCGLRSPTARTSKETAICSCGKETKFMNHFYTEDHIAMAFHFIAYQSGLRSFPDAGKLSLLCSGKFRI